MPNPWKYLYVTIATIITTGIAAVSQVPDLSFYKNFNQTMEMVRNEFLYENYASNSQASTLIATIFIIFYTVVSIKEAIIEVGILVGILSFASIAFEFSKLVCLKAVTSRRTKTVSFYQKILRVITIYNEVHGFLLFTYIIDLLIFSSLSATNISTTTAVPYIGFVFSTFIASYFLASFTAKNASLVLNFPWNFNPLHPNLNVIGWIIILCRCLEWESLFRDTTIWIWKLQL